MYFAVERSRGLVEVKCISDVKGTISVEISRVTMIITDNLYLTLLSDLQNSLRFTTFSNLFNFD